MVEISGYVLLCQCDCGKVEVILRDESPFRDEEEATRMAHAVQEDGAIVLCNVGGGVLVQALVNPPPIQPAPETLVRTGKRALAI